MDKKQKKTKNLYNFDYESKEDKKLKAKKKKADAKSASKKRANDANNQNGQAGKHKKYNDEIIIGVTEYPEKKQRDKSIEPKNKKVSNRKVTQKEINKTNKKKNQKNNMMPVQTTQKNITNKDIALNQEKRRKKRNKIIKVFALLFLVIGTITFAMVSPLFNITKITVTGNNQISNEEIISLSGIQLNSNLFRISNLKTINSIKQNAYVNEVTINKKLPNTIEISIIEREPSYILEYGNGYVYINNQGYMLEISSIKKELPIIIGTSTSKENYSAGSRLNEEDLIKLGTVIKIMNAAQSNDIANLITTIDISDSDNYTLYLESEKKTAYLGDCSNLETRMLYLVGILEKEKNVEGEIFVNMNLNTDNAFFRESV